jgi:hypothetical protein
MMKEGLRKKDIEFHLISDILPNFTDSISTYEISPYNKHPNALAHRHIAQYAVKTILER